MSKYVSDSFKQWGMLTNPNKGHYFFQVAMGSGKTYCIKEFMKKNSTCVVAPYRDSRIDYNLYPTKDGDLNTSTFMYGSDIIRSFMQSMYFKRTNTPEIQVQAAYEYGQGIGKVLGRTSKVIVIDEADFIWTQGGYDTVPVRDGNIHSHFIMTSIINGVAEESLVLSFSANKITKPNVVATYEYLEADTTVRFKEWKTTLTNNVKKSMVMKNALRDSLKDVMPTLVYSSKYSDEELNVIGSFAEDNDKKSLLVIRKDNVTKVKQANDFDTNFLSMAGWKNIRTASQDELNQSNKHYVLIEAENSQLDKVTEGDVFEEYRYVFINISSSRRVSLPKYSTENCRLIAIGSKITEHMMQAAARFRLNPVIVLIYLLNMGKKEVPLYEGTDGLALLEAIDCNYKQYCQDEPVAEYVGNMSGDAQYMKTFIDFMNSNPIKPTYKYYVIFLNGSVGYSEQGFMKVKKSIVKGGIK